MRISALLFAAAVLAFSLPTTSYAAGSKERGFFGTVFYVVTTPVRVVTKPFKSSDKKMKK